jgi:hypothetical protein
MGHFFNEEKDFFIGSVFPEWYKMHFVVLAHGEVWMQAYGCVVIVRALLEYDRFIRAEEESSTRFLDKSRKLVFEFRIKVIGAAEA